MVDASPKLIERRVKPIRILTAQKAQSNLIDHFTLANQLQKIERQADKQLDVQDCTYEYRAPDQWHSTQIGAFDSVALNSQEADSSKITSTPVKTHARPPIKAYFSPEQTCDLQSNSSTDESSSQIVSSSNSPSSESSADNTASYETAQPSLHVYNLREARTERIVKTQSPSIYVCVKPYSALHQGDLTLNYSDMVKLLHVNKDIAVIEQIRTGQCGYVPINVLKPINQFISEAY